MCVVVQVLCLLFFSLSGLTTLNERKMSNRIFLIRLRVDENLCFRVSQVKRHK